MAPDAQHDIHELVGLPKLAMLAWGKYSIEDHNPMMRE